MIVSTMKDQEILEELFREYDDGLLRKIGEVHEKMTSKYYRIYRRKVGTYYPTPQELRTVKGKNLFVVIPAILSDLRGNVEVFIRVFLKMPKEYLYKTDKKDDRGVKRCGYQYIKFPVRENDAFSIRYATIKITPHYLDRIYQRCPKFRNLVDSGFSSIQALSILSGTRHIVGDEIIESNHEIDINNMTPEQFSFIIKSISDGEVYSGFAGGYNVLYLTHREDIDNCLGAFKTFLTVDQAEKRGLTTQTGRYLRYMAGLSDDEKRKFLQEMRNKL